jgi:hypothetical protein
VDFYILFAETHQCCLMSASNRFLISRGVSLPHEKRPSRCLSNWTLANLGSMLSSVNLGFILFLVSFPTSD